MQHPLGNTPIAEDEMVKLRSEYEKILAFVSSTPTGFPYERNMKKGQPDHTGRAAGAV